MTHYQAAQRDILTAAITIIEDIAHRPEHNESYRAGLYRAYRELRRIRSDVENLPQTRIDVHATDQCGSSVSHKL